VRALVLAREPRVECRPFDLGRGIRAGMRRRDRASRFVVATF
jgi:hypothetical protein